MFRNYLAAAFRNLVRSRLYAIINVLGLAVGLCAALLIALFVRDELSYDRWITGHAQTYLLAIFSPQNGRDLLGSATANIELAALIKQDFPEVSQIARLDRASEQETLRHGEIEGYDKLFLADANIFDLLPMPLVAGDPAALNYPDGIVLTRSTARKYFGRDDPIGDTIEISRTRPMQVRAVIEDPPSQTHLSLDAIASGRAPLSALSMSASRLTPTDGHIGVQVAFTYLRIATPAAAAAVQAALSAFLERHKDIRIPDGASLQLVPLDRIHLTLSSNLVPGGGGLSPSGSMEAIYALVMVGVLIVAVACVNFINLMTSRAGRRAVEIGIRKVSGACRRHLVAQFIGETFAYVAVALLAAVLLVAALLPALRGFLGRDVGSIRDSSLAGIAVLLGVSVVTAVAAGFYPALVLSAFRPASVLRGATVNPSSLGGFRRVLVIAQFAILTGLLMVAGISYRQVVYATQESLRLNTDQILIVSPLGPPHGPENPSAVCSGAFKDSVAALSGVRGIACSSGSMIGARRITGMFKRPDGSTMTVWLGGVDHEFFDVYGLKPIAGRVFGPEDRPVRSNPDATIAPAVVSETAVRRYGFTTPADAVGQIVDVPIGGYLGTKAQRIEIIGVLPEMSGNVRLPSNPMLYFLSPERFDMLSVKLSGRDIPETLSAIDRLWTQYGDPTPPPRRFLNDEVESRYRDIIRQAELFSVFAAIAGFIAALGLFGLSVFTAESRTKEIGVRKALGASRRDILGLLLWEFGKPVLWANLIAWPAAYLSMRRWLEGFALHIALAPWMFMAASVIALLIAMLTVMGHVLLVARTRPAMALRYE